MEIIWDPKKAATNFKKHGVRFADAEVVLFDPYALTMEDIGQYNEQRMITLGMDALGRLLTVIYTYRDDQIRIISARKVTKKERLQYEKGI